MERSLAGNSSGRWTMNLRNTSVSLRANGAPGGCRTVAQRTGAADWRAGTHALESREDPAASAASAASAAPATQAPGRPTITGFRESRVRIGTRLVIFLAAPLLVLMALFGWLDQERSTRLLREELAKEGRAIARTVQFEI